MASVKRITDLMDYASVLPYASELFGVYQPLLGWKSKRIAGRFEAGFEQDKPYILDKLKRQFADLVDVSYPDGRPQIQIRSGVLRGGKLRPFDSVVLERLASRLPANEDLRPEVWNDVISKDKLDAILRKDVVETYTRVFDEMRRVVLPKRAAGGQGRNTALVAFEHQLRHESSVAGALLFLKEEKAHKALEEIFYTTKDDTERARALVRMLENDNGAQAFIDIGTLDPQNRDHLERVALSPISAVHLFRQYFFELDSFLGSPESHVWLRTRA